MMNLRRTARFDANFTELDSQSQKAIRKALCFLVNDLRHPSLSVRKKWRDGITYLKQVLIWIYVLPSL